jgi:hypothetical protein
MGGPQKTRRCSCGARVCYACWSTEIGSCLNCVDDARQAGLPPIEGLIADTERFAGRPRRRRGAAAEDLEQPADAPAEE